MKSPAFVLALSILTLTACRSTPPPQVQAPSPPQPVVTTGYPNLMVQAKQLETALASKDYGKVVDLTHPKVVELAGGRDKMVAVATHEVQSMEAEGVVILSSSYGAPTQFVSDTSGVYALIPVVSKVKATDGIFQTEGCLIAVSTDGGQNWTFVDASGKDQTELKKVLPNLDKFNLPPEKKPVKVAEK
jgi:hypothetical protein